MMTRSIIEYYAGNERYKCGYCNKPDSNYSHGLWAHTMTVSDYQDLIDRGWRRSGNYCYKPSLDVICCPMYTIRCRALEFKPSKSQKKVLKRVNKFLMGQDELNSAENLKSNSCEDMTVENVDIREAFMESFKGHHNIGMEIPFIEEKGDLRNDKAIKLTQEIGEASTSSTRNEIEEPVRGPQQNNINTVTHTKSCKVEGPNPAKATCKKAKQLRKERMLEKLKQKGVDISSKYNSNKTKEKQLEDFINELPKKVKRKLEVKLVRTTPPSREWLASAKETHQVYVKYQMTVHGDTPEKCSEPKFHDFLVQSPLLEEYSELGPPCGYGSFHQQYWLDGKLIAVGVLDILPKCVSSVYFFYDPDYRNLTLGTYGALREIAFSRQLHTLCPNLKYYYMGYYIHSCQKMRYKGNYFPSDLLCPETYKWFPIKDCIPKLEAVPNARLDPDLDSIDENFPKDSDIDDIPVLHKGEILKYKLFRRKVDKKTAEVKDVQEYACLVGAKTARSLIFVK